MSPNPTRPLQQRRDGVVGNLWWLVAEMRPELAWQLLSLGCLILNAGLILSEPLIVKHIIDELIPRSRVLPLLIAGSLLLVVSVTRLALGAASTRIVSHVEQQIVLRLKMKLLRHLNSLSADFHDKTPPGTNMFVIQECTAELGQLSTELLGTYLRTMVLFVGTLSTMFYLNVRLALVVLPLLAVFVWIVSRASSGLQRASEAVQEYASRASNVLQEHLVSIFQTQLLMAERAQERRAFRAWASQARANYDRNRAEIVCGFSSSALIVAGGAAVFCYGSIQVVHQALTIGGLVAFYRCLDRLFDPLFFSIDLNTRVQRATANVTRIRALLELKASVSNSAVTQTLKPRHLGASIAFDRVEFGYRTDRRVIDNVSITVNSGERIAIVGPSGCGKSTVAKLIARAHDVKQGAVLLDGSDVRDLRLEQIRSYIAYVPQRPVLFDATLEDNLRVGNRWASMGELRAAAQDSLLTPVIERLPRGWREALGPNGGLLSGGERQRLAIARALLRHPHVLILDESTAELDLVAERHILDSINRTLPETTLIFITHRLPAVSWVDRIIVMDRGQVLEIGPHHALYENNLLYRSLFHQQNLDTSARRGIAG
jgi:ABC-type bacteriocin/lantibiotic exporter with double-glycine peptidase domain